VNPRETILARVRSAARRERAHPGAFSPAVRSVRWPAFAQALAAVGGEAHGPLAPEASSAYAADLCERRADGGRIVASASACRQLGPGPWQVIDPAAGPHAFADVAVAVLMGAHGVVENGAVALRGDEVMPRAVHVLAQHVLLLISVEELVADMHGAVKALGEGALGQHHLTWVSGPSKTSDIESTLVIGAHGPRSLDVLGLAGTLSS
jgi:L-lactate dehydrogenase complex protein LldG